MPLYNEAEIDGAIEMARGWLRDPGSMVDAGFEQVCRELYTISVALVRLANREAELREVNR